MFEFQLQISSFFLSFFLFPLLGVSKGWSISKVEYISMMNFIIRGRGINACFLIAYAGTVDYSCSKDIAPTAAPPESTPSNLSLFDR